MPVERAATREPQEQPMPRSSTSFQLGDVSTGEPHLYCSGSLGDRRYLARLEHDPRELQLRTAIAIHLPRVALISCGAAALFVCLVASARAEAPRSAAWTTPECAERDLKVTALIEEHGDTSDLPGPALGEIGLAQLDARLTCLSDQKVEALAKYDTILNAPYFARHAKDRSHGSSESPSFAGARQ
jgi:hypothetical protein